MRQVHRRIVDFLGGITLAEMMERHTESTAPLTPVTPR
jgi:hypothetical protein